jgi:hypothetical protein
VSRDRGGGYGEAVARALPNAIQVADRWHLEPARVFRRPDGLSLYAAMGMGSRAA